MFRFVKIARGLSLDELRARTGDGGRIYTVAHFGAWEIAGAAAPLLGGPITSLMRPLDNPLLDKYLGRIRMRFGQRLASNRGGFRDLVAELRAGRSVAVLVDLNMKRQGAVFVDYFAVPAATAKTAAVLAMRSGRPLVPIFSHRTRAPYQFEIEIGEPIFAHAEIPDRDAESHRLLQEVTKAVELRVRASPDQWLWTHRRWKTRPEEAPGAEASST
jgi:KDO2-lipid IV(A) lauroyltransferase